jgi:V/A-type H+/Na+-transporting ATPase subunit I
LPIGWIALGLGGFLTWMGFSAASAALLLKPVGLVVLILGGAGVMWYTKIDPVWWKRLLGGFNSVPRLSGIFGDTLSYLRLFALGLAGASLSMIFNDLSAKIDAAVPGIGILLALLILAFGHVLNFVLSLMGAVIHGLRLNYIEFFNWSLSEEGYLFKAFARKEKVAWKDY